MSEDNLVTLSIRVYRWQKELLEKKAINKSQLIRDLLTQHFKGSGSVEGIDKYFIELEEIKKELAEVKKIFEEGKKFVEIINPGLATLDKLEKRVQEIEAELLERYEVLREAGGEGDLGLRGLIEEVFEDVLRDGVDNWVRSKVAGERGIKVLFEKVLPNKAKERGIKLDLKKAKEIIKKYYPEIAKYLR